MGALERLQHGRSYGELGEDDGVGPSGNEIQATFQHVQQAFENYRRDFGGLWGPV
tara:strand:- start:29 stop:193 length:165 start_codon:yes stop_codon:yes gene_type:complete